MRDDFTQETRRTLAARIGNACSNPDCCAFTSGPQDDPTKALNVGVAAHITGASPLGARYNGALSPVQRRHPDNGIWLCQTHPKLVDNDAIQSPEELLRAWKTVAEHRARHSIGNATTPASESELQRKKNTILGWKGKDVTLSQMSTGQAVMSIGPKRGSACVQVLDCTEDYVSVGKTGANAWSRSIALTNIEICRDDPNNRLELQERYA